MKHTKRKIYSCIVCNSNTERKSYIYCSNKCQADLRYKKYIEAWKKGDVAGLIKIGVVSNHVKRYLREKYGNRCCLCGWSEINPRTNLVPLVADHIDGNWRNNKESNLRLICPNCDSLSDTYAALNKGNGRQNRRPSKRVFEARDLLSNKISS